MFAPQGAGNQRRVQDFGSVEYKPCTDEPSRSRRFKHLATTAREAKHGEGLDFQGFRRVDGKGVGDCWSVALWWSISRPASGLADIDETISKMFPDSYNFFAFNRI